MADPQAPSLSWRAAPKEGNLVGICATDWGWMPYIPGSLTSGLPIGYGCCFTPRGPRLTGHHAAWPWSCAAWVAAWPARLMTVGCGWFSSLSPLFPPPHLLWKSEEGKATKNAAQEQVFPWEPRPNLSKNGEKGKTGSIYSLCFEMHIADLAKQVNRNLPRNLKHKRNKWGNTGI